MVVRVWGVKQRNIIQAIRPINAESYDIHNGINRRLTRGAYRGPCYFLSLSLNTFLNFSSLGRITKLQ